MNKLWKYTLILFVLIVLAITNIVKAQESPSTAQEVQSYINQRSKLTSSSLIKNYPVHSVGPVVMAGRVTDIAVNPRNVNEFYIAYASGGVFKTTNNGSSFQPIFDGNGTLTIGDIALSKANPDIIWAGTGEVNSSRSSYPGTGVYKSVNGGKTWTFEGLTNTQHISRIITHPTNPNIAWVASEGPLYSNSDARGVYKTMDGGKTWKKTLFINDTTGVIDLAINPQNPKQLWAATWTRKRYAWNFIGDGPGSSIYVSNDGGNTWEKSDNGFLTGPDVGRIGLSVCQTKPNILYAIVDSQAPVKKKKSKKKEEQKPEKLTFSSFKNMSADDFMKLEDKKLNEFLRSNGFPKKYTAESVKNDIRAGQYTIKDIADYNGIDAATAETSSDVVGAEIFRSDDYGKHWHKVNKYLLEGVYYTYGYYFAQIRVNPDNPNEIFIFGVPVLKSEDGGKTFSLVGGDTHGDNHAFWYDPSNPKHIILGTDGGAYVSYDSGTHWNHLNNMAVGQFYSVDVDNDTPFNIYGGLQDNGVFYGSSKTIPNKSPHWKRLLGGDGMHVAVDPRDNGIVYAGFQFGNYFRVNRNTMSHTYITPKHDIGQPAYRWNWNTPIVLSPHNPDIVYMGSQRLLRSMDQGDHFTPISPDLTTDRKQGNVPYSTITTISESPLKFGVIWVGTDDGNVQLTRDGGVHWELVSGALPQKFWVSSVFASPYDEATAFVSLTGYRYDDFRSMLYKTTDYGKTWHPISGDLPDENINVIVQDPVNPDLLFAGTDDGAYMSQNAGKNWQVIDTSMPNVPTYDMVIQKRDHVLVMGTHGRSVYTMNITPFEKMTENKLNTPVVAFKPKEVMYSGQWGKAQYPYMKPVNPDVTLLYYVGQENHSANVSLTIASKDGKVLRRLDVPATVGFHPYSYDLKMDKRASKDHKAEYLKPGTYKVLFRNGSAKSETFLTIKSRNHNNNEDIPGEND